MVRRKAGALVQREGVDRQTSQPWPLQGRLGQDLAREYLPLVSGSPRRDGIALSKLKPLLLDAEIETVTCDRRQRALDPVLHYSVIRSIRLSPDVAQPI